MYAHKRVELVGGVNIWGYRGRTARERLAGDIRLLYVGCTRAYGYGAAADGTMPYVLEWNLKGWTRQPVSVINAAATGAVAQDYEAIVARYLGLQPDVVILYDDLGFARTRPRRSRIAEWFAGYTPVLPIALEEKGMFMQRDARRWKQAAGGVLRKTGAVLREWESPPAPAMQGDYASFMIAAAARARATTAAALLAVDPPVDGSTAAHLAALRNAVTAMNDPRLRLAVLPQPAGPEELLDGYSYGAAARGRAALALGPDLLALVR